MNAITTANDINTEHRLARQHAESAVQHAIRCGELLALKKSELKHGQFGAWVEANCDFSYRQARKYVQASKLASRGQFDFNSLREALGYDKPEPEPAGTPRYDAAKHAVKEWREYTGTEEFQNLGPEHLPELAKIAQDFQPEQDAAAARARAEKMTGEMLNTPPTRSTLREIERALPHMDAWEYITARSRDDRTMHIQVARGLHKGCAHVAVFSMGPHGWRDFEVHYSPEPVPFDSVATVAGQWIEPDIWTMGACGRSGIDAVRDLIERLEAIERGDHREVSA